MRRRCHVGRLAEKLGIRQIVVPRDAGVGSAVGFLRAPVAYEVVKSRHMRLDDFDPKIANDLLADMQSEARAVVEAATTDMEFEELRGASMRYVGQGHEVFVPLPGRPLTDLDDAILRSAYEKAYEELFGRVIRNAEVEVLTWLLKLTSVDEPSPPRSEVQAQPEPKASAMREIADPANGKPVTVPVHSRLDLVPGASVAGPSLIAEDQNDDLRS